MNKKELRFDSQSGTPRTRERHAPRPGTQASSNKTPNVKQRGYAKIAGMVSCWAEIEQIAKNSRAKGDIAGATPVKPAAPALRAIVPPLKLAVSPSSSPSVATGEVRGARDLAGSPGSRRLPRRPRGTGDATVPAQDSNSSSSLQSPLVTRPDSPRELKATPSPRGASGREKVQAFTPMVKREPSKNASDGSTHVEVSNDISKGIMDATESYASFSETQSAYENRLYESRVRGGDNPLYIHKSDRATASVQATQLERNREAYLKKNGKMRPAEQVNTIAHLLDTLRATGANALEIRKSISIAEGSEARIARSILNSVNLSRGPANSELTDGEISYAVTDESGNEREWRKDQLSAVIGPVAQRFRPEASNKLVDVLLDAANDARTHSSTFCRTDVKSIGWTFVHQDDGGLKASYKMQFRIGGSQTLAQVSGSIDLDDSNNAVRASNPVMSLPENMASTPPRSRGLKS